MARYLRRFSLSLGALTILAVLVAMMVGTTAAAPLTGGNTTYLIGGEEVMITFDPVSRKDGLLLPHEVFQKFNIEILGATSKNPEVQRGDVKIQLTLGSNAATVNGVAKTINPAPLRLNGRIFLAADLLKEFGIEYSQDGAYLSFRDQAEGLSMKPSSDYKADKLKKSISGDIKSDTGSIMLKAEYTLLTPELVASPELTSDYGFRVRLLRLLENNTLVMARISNEYSTRAVGWNVGGLYLVDNNKVQYDYTGQAIELKGLVTTKIAPTAEKVSILVYPKLQEGWHTINVYFDPNAASLGNFYK